MPLKCSNVNENHVVKETSHCLTLGYPLLSIFHFHPDDWSYIALEKESSEFSSTGWTLLYSDSYEANFSRMASSYKMSENVWIELGNVFLVARVTHWITCFLSFI